MIESTEALDAGTVDAEAVFADIVSRLSGLQWNPQMTGPQAFGAMKQVLLLRNLVDHHATTLTGEMDRLGVADHKTTRLRELLISMGFAPAVASRYVRFAGTTDVDLLLAHAADGSHLLRTRRCHRARVGAHRHSLPRTYGHRPTLRIPAETAVALLRRIHPRRDQSLRAAVG
ncbi:hypothetical protein GOPIP_001_00660 [Gordonia polyisoprenivorans NBRC 16320 = JCM 10675]|nr:hypothetical protein GOPIP_001_00660 [Gordonia polyisoprenivorans NBRC 16320 = JCM 10675]